MISRREAGLFDLIELASGGKHGCAAVFVCYVDDSAADTSPVVTMAGYVSPILQWQIFETATAPLWSRYEIDILHATDFHNGRGNFKGWSFQKKNQFVSDLYEIASLFVPIGMSVSVNDPAFRISKKSSGKHQGTSSYGVAFGYLAHSLSIGNDLCDFVRASGISFVIENGNYAKSLLEWFNSVQDHELYKGVFKTISFAKKTDSRAIQLADFFAFYSRRYAMKTVATGKPPEFERHYRTMLQWMPQHHMLYMEDPSGVPVANLDEVRFAPSSETDFERISGFHPKLVQ